MAVFGILLIPGMMVIPVIIALIYKIFYNKHINGAGGKKWISPLSVGLISLLVLTFAVVTTVSIGFVSYRFSPERNLEIDTSQNTSETLTQEEFKKSEYTVFNGRGVSGYRLENKTDGNFEYQLYSKVNGGPASMPDYFIIIHYTGEKDYETAEANYGVEDKTGGSSFGVMLEKSETYYAAIDGDHIVYKDRNGNEVDYPYDLIYHLSLCSQPKNTDGGTVAGVVDELKIKLA